MGPDFLTDGLRHVVDTLHTTMSDVVTDLSGAGDVAGTQIVDSTSNGVSLVKGKTESLQKTRMMRAAHSRHKYILHVVRFMLRNSLRNKVRIMIPGFVASLLMPAPVLAALRPAFALFGAHLGAEALHDAEYLLHHRKKKSKEQTKEEGKESRVLNKDVPNKMTIRQVIKKANDADRTTTYEVTAAVLGSIDNLPITEQIPIMGLYVAGMTAGIYGMTIAIVKMEDVGLRLQEWQPQTGVGRLLAATTLPARVGSLLELAAPRFFQVMPVLGTAAKFVTSGRVISHASPFVEDAIENTAHVASRILPMHGELLHASVSAVTTVSSWGALGIVAGLGTQSAQRYVVQPVVEKLQERGILKQWKNAAHSSLLSLVFLQDVPAEKPLTESRRAQSYIFAHRPLSRAEDSFKVFLPEPVSA